MEFITSLTETAMTAAGNAGYVMAASADSSVLAARDWPDFLLDAEGQAVGTGRAPHPRGVSTSAPLRDDSGWHPPPSMVGVDYRTLRGDLLRYEESVLSSPWSVDRRGRLGRCPRPTGWSTPTVVRRPPPAPVATAAAEPTAAASTPPHVWLTNLYAHTPVSSRHRRHRPLSAAAPR